LHLKPHQHEGNRSLGIENDCVIAINQFMVTQFIITPLALEDELSPCTVR